MKNYIKEESSALWQFLKNYGKEIIIVAFGTLFIVLDAYYPIHGDTLSSFLYYGLFPILTILVILRKNPLDFGLRWGSPRIWLPWVGVICLIAGLILYTSSFSTSLQRYYLDPGFSFFIYFLIQCVKLSSQEFMYRGFLLFGLKDKLKEGAILVQMIPFVFVHLTKPDLETISTIITGIIFGWVAYRGKSFWPAFIIHLFINVFFVTLINYVYG
jgi:membrane protease YdiL (CAAX protease family)